MFERRLFFVFLAFKWINCVVEVPVIPTEFGAVRGVYEENEQGRFISYSGIPFARHPPGNVFGDPVNPEPWTGILEANNVDVKCPQREEFHNSLVGDIDCLKLNVYVPANRKSKDPLPVLYFIYGGANKYGFNSRYVWGSFKLVRHDIIVVIANYRVGPFGFLCLGTKDVPGNAAHKDARKGLQWVKNNIRNFGGDPHRVTLGGSSTGSMMVEQIIISPTTDHFYERVILESSSLYNLIFNANTDHTDDILKMTRYFGYKTNSVDDAVRFLQTISHFDILVASEKLRIKFMQCIEPKIDGVEHFLTDFPVTYFENANFTFASMITGFNTIECPMGTVSKKITKRFENYFSSILNLLNLSDKDLNQLTKAVRYFYIGSQAVSDKVEPELSIFNSDAGLIYPITRSAIQYRAKVPKVYLYEFGYAGNRNLGRHNHNLTTSAATHADEVGYLFDQEFWTTPLTPSDRLVTDRMTTMWTNFVKYGNPTPKVTELLPVKWQPMRGNTIDYLYINTEMKNLIDPYKERMAFWDMIFYNYYKLNYADAVTFEYEL